jgi:hypothetical protein
VSAALRLWVRLRHEQLDRRLAEGASPSTPPLRLRADELTSMPARRSMARTAEVICDEETDASRAARGELTALAARLRAPEPITPVGAARAHRLLRRPPGDEARRALWERAWDVTDALDDHAR